MQNNRSFFKYISGNSKVHTMNSKLKILWFIFSAINLIFIKEYFSLFMLAAVVLYIVIESKISILEYLSNLLLPWPIYVLLFGILYMFTGNIYFCCLITAKVLLFILILIVITLTTSLSEIAWGIECLLEKLKKIKVPVTKIALKIALSIKLVSTLFDQMHEVRKSMAYRGVPYNNLNVIKTFKKIFIPALSLSIRQIKRTNSAMKMRFYGKEKRRTNYHDYKPNKFAKILVVISAVLIYESIIAGYYRPFDYLVNYEIFN